MDWERLGSVVLAEEFGLVIISEQSAADATVGDMLEGRANQKALPPLHRDTRLAPVHQWRDATRVANSQLACSSAALMPVRI